MSGCSLRKAEIDGRKLDDEKKLSATPSRSVVRESSSTLQGKIGDLARRGLLVFHFIVAWAVVIAIGVIIRK